MKIKHAVIENSKINASIQALKSIGAPPNFQMQHISRSDNKYSKKQQSYNFELQNSKNSIINTIDPSYKPGFGQSISINQ